MEVRHLRYFVAVAETRNFTRAAAQSFVAQSALSQQIARLESEVGARLLDRDTRTVSLTEAGELLLPLARQIIAQVEGAQLEIDALTGLQRGRLRLGLLQSTTMSIDVIGVMKAFHDRYPGVEFATLNRPSVQLVELVAEGGLDLATVGLRADEVPAGLAYRLLGETPLTAVLAAGHPLVQRRRVGLAQLAEAGQFINFTAGTGIRRRVDEAFARAGLENASHFEIGQISDIMRLVGAGVGVSLIPLASTVTDPPDAGDAVVRAIPLTDREAVHPLGLVFSPERMSPAARAFLEMLSAA